jgi:hypothetical protein
LPAGTVTALLSDIPQLTDILLHHVVGDSVLSAMLSNNLVVPTLNRNVLVSITNGVVFIESENGTIAQVTVADITADNGVLHVIDAVLLPETPTTEIIENGFGNGLKIYPNPTNGDFTIDLGENHQNTKISITDLKGRLVQSIAYVESQLLSLKLEDPAGVYLLVIKTGDKKKVIRLIKQ